VFDPADKVLGLKVPLFVLAWILVLVGVMANRGRLHVPQNMMRYLALFLLIPIVSILCYFMAGGDTVNYDGFQYFKSYLFVSLLVILYLSELDLILPLVAVLTALAGVSIMLLVIGYYDFPLVMELYDEVCLPYGICSIGTRDFGRFILPSMPQVFFHTSPLLVFSIAYFTRKALYSAWTAKIIYGPLLTMHAIAMFFGGTKTNIVFSIITPVAVAYWYSKRKWLLLLGILITLCMLYVNSWDAIMASVFRPDEQSNYYKISFLSDYRGLFSDPGILLFGQGLGSYFDTAIRGRVSLTEFTYLEFIRRFGVILSLLSFALLAYPLRMLAQKKYRDLHYVFIAYFCYLIMSFTNPLLMSSTGMLLLSVVLYLTFVPSASPFSRPVQAEVWK
jgi:hypothetical protein